MNPIARDRQSWRVDSAERKESPYPDLGYQAIRSEGLSARRPPIEMIEVRLRCHED